MSNLLLAGTALWKLQGQKRQPDIKAKRIFWIQDPIQSQLRWLESGCHSSQQDKVQRTGVVWQPQVSTINTPVLKVNDAKLESYLPVENLRHRWEAVHLWNLDTRSYTALKSGEQGPQALQNQISKRGFAEEKCDMTWLTKMTKIA